jgi:hypothetical protein
MKAIALLLLLSVASCATDKTPCSKDLTKPISSCMGGPVPISSQMPWTHYRCDDGGEIRVRTSEVDGRDYCYCRKFHNARKSVCR